jgi:hypothetical protein
MRLPLVAPLESRDGSSNKDSRMTNALAESEEGGSVACVRPGLVELNTTTGNGKGLVSFNDTLLSVYGSTLNEHGSSISISATSETLPVSDVSANRIVGNDDLGYIAVGSDFSVIHTLPPSFVWASVTVPVMTSVKGINLVNNIFVMFGVIGGVVHSVTSPDGIVWTDLGAVTTLGTASNKHAFYKAGVYYVSDGGSFYTSPDLINWTLISTSVPTATVLGINQIVLAGSTFVAVTSGKIYTSADAITWTLAYEDLAGSYIGSNGFVRYENSLVIALLGTTNDSLLFSSNLSVWQSLDLPSSSGVYRGFVTAGAATFVIPESGSDEWFRTTNMNSWSPVVGSDLLYILENAVYSAELKSIIVADNPSNGDAGYYEVGGIDALATSLSGDSFDFAQSTL